jgi:hypothetical protein
LTRSYRFFFKEVLNSAVPSTLEENRTKEFISEIIEAITILQKGDRKIIRDEQELDVNDILSTYLSQFLNDLLMNFPWLVHGNQYLV